MNGKLLEGNIPARYVYCDKRVEVTHYHYCGKFSKLRRKWFKIFYRLDDKERLMEDLRCHYWKAKSSIRCVSILQTKKLIRQKSQPMN